ncbi:hypothetical protein AAVH_21682 [Aphelenchoides avenae]|nr:hypothetical protein AAVH_21682 [Aphelenchus avenae]
MSMAYQTLLADLRHALDAIDDRNDPRIPVIRDSIRRCRESDSLVQFELELRRFLDFLRAKGQPAAQVVRDDAWPVAIDGVVHLPPGQPPAPAPALGPVYVPPDYLAKPTMIGMMISAPFNIPAGHTLASSQSAADHLEDEFDQSATLNAE